MFLFLTFIRWWGIGWLDKQEKSRAKFTGKAKGLGLLRCFLPSATVLSVNKGTMRLSRNTERVQMLKEISPNRKATVWLSDSTSLFSPDATLSLVIVLLVREESPDRSYDPDMPSGGKKGPPSIRKPPVRFLPNPSLRCVWSVLSIRKDLKAKDWPRSKSNTCPSN